MISPGTGPPSAGSGVTSPRGDSRKPAIRNGVTPTKPGAGYGGVMRVLIAEDEPALAALLAKGLRRRAMAVDVARDGAEALERLAIDDYDVLVLDRDLPEVHGDDVCRRLAAERARVRILMPTAAAAPAERVAGLNLGADDYLPKPFDYDEL